MQNKKQYPESIAGAFIRNNKGELLLVKSHKWEGKRWSVPGGHIEWGETVKDALHREVREEVGIEVSNMRIFAIYEAIFPKFFKKKKHFIFIECECLASPDSKIILDKEEIQEAKWFTLDEALKLNLEAYAEKSVKLLIENTTSFFDNR